MVFHAGDGNVHPNIVFDPANLFETAQVKKAVKEIHAATLAHGGSISGEHGIGIEKRAAMADMFDSNALELFRKIKKELDGKNLANPDKVIPISTGRRQNAAPAYAQEIIEAAKRVRSATIAGLSTKLRRAPSISLAALDKIIDIDKVNYTVTAQAGASLKNIEKQLAAHGMYLPVPAAAGSIGGAFAAKTFLDFSDYIIGIDLVLPGGAFISLGGKHVKNSAGYDLIRLLHGSMGAYAIITALTVRTFAQPAPKQPKREFEIFKPSPLARRLKNAFDPQNVFNPFIFDGGTR